MSAIEYGLTTANSYIVEGQTHKTSRTGLVSMEESWLIRTQDVTTVFPVRFAANPRVAGLFYQESTSVDIGGGVSRATVSWEGWNASGSGGSGGGGSPEDNPPVYVLENSGETAPITQHGSVATWIASERAAGRDPAPDNIFTGWLFGAVSSGTKSLFGQESYHRPAPVWVKEWIVSVLPADIADVGKVTTLPDGYPYATSATANWLILENSFREVGPNLWARRKVWKRSADNSWGGWNTDVYPLA